MIKQKYNFRIYNSVREYYKWNFDKYLSDENINKLSRIDVLRAYLGWQGIIGYDQDIIEITNLNR